MRLLCATTCLIVVALLLLCAAPLEARGGKGGGGGGRGRGNSGGGHGGGPKWSGQQSHNGAGWQRAAEHEQKPNHGGKQQFDKHTQPVKDKQHDKQARSTPTNDTAGDASDAFNKKQKQLEIEQRNRDKRLAQAQHLREIGERNGNQNLLDNADRMEAFAHDHYARRVTHLEKFGVTDPLLNPGGGFTDAMFPGTGGHVDALSDFGALDNFLP